MNGQFWAVTTGSARRAVALYFEPIRRLWSWLSMRRLFLAAAFSCLALPASALPITYQYNQNGQSLPGLAIHVFITIDGIFANLPSLTCAPCPDGTVLNFGHLLGFTLFAPSGRVFTLANFRDEIVFPSPSGEPLWTISPSQIKYIDVFEAFDINLASGLIHYDQDGIGLCGASGVCVTSGTFAAVVPVATPEPATVVLFVTGLAAIGVAHRRRISLA